MEDDTLGKLTSLSMVLAIIRARFDNRFAHTPFAVCMFFRAHVNVLVFTLHTDEVQQCVPEAVSMQQCSDRFCTESIFAVLHTLN